MVRRLSHPGKPIVLVDLGRANGIRHDYTVSSKPMDQALTERRTRREHDEMVPR